MRQTWRLFFGLLTVVLALGHGAWAKPATAPNPAGALSLQRVGSEVDLIQGNAKLPVGPAQIEQPEAMPDQARGGPVQVRLSGDTVQFMPGDLTQQASSATSKTIIVRRGQREIGNLSLGDFFDTCYHATKAERLDVLSNMGEHSVTFESAAIAGDSTFVLAVWYLPYESTQDIEFSVLIRVQTTPVLSVKLVRELEAASDGLGGWSGVPEVYKMGKALLLYHDNQLDRITPAGKKIKTLAHFFEDEARSSILQGIADHRWLVLTFYSDGNVLLQVCDIHTGKTWTLPGAWQDTGQQGTGGTAYVILDQAAKFLIEQQQAKRVTVVSLPDDRRTVVNLPTEVKPGWGPVYLWHGMVIVWNSWGKSTIVRCYSATTGKLIKNLAVPPIPTKLP